MHKRMYVWLIVIITGVIAAGSWAQVSSSSESAPAEVATKILHFPPDQCMGNLYIENHHPGSPYLSPGSDPSLPFGLNTKLISLGNISEFVGPAQGDIAVPAGRNIILGILLRLRPGDSTRLSMLSRNFLQNRYNVGPDDLSGLSGLGPDDLYKLSVASLVSRRDVGERVLEALSHLSGLQILCLSGTGVTDEQMEYLKALRSLKALELHQEYSVSDPGLAVLKKLPALEYLDLETRATDAGFKHLAQLQNLRYLKIQTGMIWGPGLAELAKLPCLERLCLWGWRGLSNRHIRNLEGLTRLKSLTLWGTGYRLTDADLVSIGKLTGLEELYFIKIATNFTNSGMTHLKSLKNLRKVDFASSQIGDTRIRHLAALPNLEAIEGGLLLNSESTKTLASFQNLKSLHVGLEVPQSQSAPTDMANIAGLKNLEELIIDGRQLSDEDLTCIESLSCLRKLSFIGKDVTDRTMASISKLKQLEYFKLYLSSLTKSGLNQLGGLTNLRVLDVSVHPNSRCSADEVRLDLSGLTNLNTLELSGFSLQDADLRSLTGLDHLEWLKLQNESLSEEALRHLKNLSGLRRLYINEVSCSTGSGLVHLAGLTKLTDLTLQGRIRDAALDRLTGLAALRNLRIVTDEPIRTQTISNLRQRLPAIAYINIEKLTQISRPANRENQARKRVNPPRVNQQRSRARRRRR